MLLKYHPPQNDLDIEGFEKPLIETSL